MADVETLEQRRKNMQAIKSKDTKPEIFLRHELFHRGYRYRKNTAKITGHPDIWMAKYNTAIFIHGCFWHRHSGCKYAYTPRTRIDFWNTKFGKNIQRDQAVKKSLDAEGIRCLIVWECTIRKMNKSKEYCDHILDSIETFLSSNKKYDEL